MPRAALAIQKIIQVTKPTATIDSDAADASCASKVRPRGPNVSSAPKRERDGDRERHAGPDPGEQVATVGLDQVGDEDADDQGCLEAFAQPDQVVGEHGGS